MGNYMTGQGYSKGQQAGMVAAIMMTGTFDMTAAQTAYKNQEALRQAKLERGLYKYQADLMDSRASVAEENAAIERQRLAVKRRQDAAAGMTDFAGNGMLIDDEANAAPNIWEQDFAAETAWQQEEIKSNAMYEIWGYKQNAKMLRTQGDMVMDGARAGVVASAFQSTQQYSSIATSAITKGKSG
jgi:hypothetical protein